MEIRLQEKPNRSRCSSLKNWTSFSLLQSEEAPMTTVLIQKYIAVPFIDDLITVWQVVCVELTRCIFRGPMSSCVIAEWKAVVEEVMFVAKERLWRHEEPCGTVWLSSPCHCLEWKDNIRCNWTVYKRKKVKRSQDKRCYVTDTYIHELLYFMLRFIQTLQ